ncbi:MAG TPA: response regulator transcription factor [Pyrinomonadaceae bacterium]|nr:response regulator transcription factor [Pyrinomonadaceae bacterium]
MNPNRVVLVDDHVLVRAGIRALIDMIDGVEVVGEAGNGPEALSLIEQLMPDLVLLDITMPGVKGLAVLEQITHRFPQVRVIMLTMHEAREYVIQSLKAGAAGFIPKSAATAELREAIDTVMRGKTFVSRETAQADLAAVDAATEQQALVDKLTPRQREILVLIAEGRSTKQIARALNISVKTVESHRAQLTERLDIHDVAGLVRLAIRTGLVRME